MKLGSTVSIYNLFQKSLFISNFWPLGLLQEAISFKKNYIFPLLSSTISVFQNQSQVAKSYFQNQSQVAKNLK